MRIWSSVPQACRSALRWDSISGAVSGLFSGALFPFLGVIARRDLHASAYLIATLNASGSVGNLFNPVMAHHIRGRVKLPYAVWPIAIGRSFFLLMPLAVVAPTFVAISFLSLAVAALGSPAYAAVIRDAYPVERRGQLMGMVRVIAVGGAMVGALLGGFALERVSYRWVFVAAAAVGLIGIAAFTRIGVPGAPPKTPPARPRLVDQFREAARDREFRLYAACFYLYGLGNLIMGPAIPILQVDVLRITPQWVGYLATTAAGCSMVGYLVWGRVLDRHGPFRLMGLVLLVIAVMPVTYYFAGSVPVLLIAAAASGFAMAGGDLGYVNAAMRFGSRDAAVAYAGVFAFLQACRGIPGPFIGAAVSRAAGPRMVFVIALALWAVSASVLLASGRLRRGREEVVG